MVGHRGQPPPKLEQHPGLHLIDKQGETKLEFTLKNRRELHLSYPIFSTTIEFEMVSLGEELKREREFREISLREISEATKINMRILQAIEDDNYKILPGGIFNRNFIRAYAEFIGLDPEIAVRKYQVQFSQEGDSKIPPLAISVIQASSPTVWGIRRSVFFVVLATILGALLFLILWVYRSRLPVERFLQLVASNFSKS